MLPFREVALLLALPGALTAGCGQDKGEAEGGVEPSCQDIVIQSPVVEQFVQALLHKGAGGPITDEKIKNIRMVYIPEGGDLCGLEDLACMDSLYWVLLDNAHIASLEPIARLDDLQWISFYNNNITEVAPLFEGVPKTKLHKLQLGMNLIDDLSGLETATEINELHLDYNRITNIGQLSALTRLEWLSLTHNQVSDITPLVDNPGLGTGDRVFLMANLLDQGDCPDIKALRDRGVQVYHDVAACP